MTLLAVEPCPPDAPVINEIPCYGGRLFFAMDRDTLCGQERDVMRAGCPGCGWSGVPTIVGHVISTRCPACERESEDVVEEVLCHHVPIIQRVPRNQPCPCGSGIKAKRCDCAAYTA